jgi:uncharacterized protein (DUF362 family)/NAD-dependent dihydropyrimidine dehydrogenase PreA subunit
MLEERPASRRSTVAVVKCNSYDRDEVLAAVRRGTNLIGGIRSFAKSGETILVKPNVLLGANPDKCVSTHPSVFRAVCICLKEYGCNLTYGDSPALYDGWGRSEPALRKSGLAAVAEELGVSCADFASGAPVKNSGAVSHRLFMIADGVRKADGVVSVPKLKTHGLTRMTGALKNQYGCVPGTHKGQYHARVPNVHDFSRLLADITAFVKPRLYVMDAVMAMEGNGPMNGDPRKVGVLLVSADPVALDATACRLINLDPSFVPVLQPGEDAGLGTWDARRIDIAGDAVEQFVVRDFRVIRSAPLSLPDHGVTRFIRNAVVTRPVISRSACTRCGACIRACPVALKAIGWGAAENSRPPLYNYGRCIRCFCCHEICPSGAITVATPMLGRLLPFLSYFSLVFSNMRAKRWVRRGKRG